MSPYVLLALIVIALGVCLVVIFSALNRTLTSARKGLLGIEVGALIFMGVVGLTTLVSAIGTLTTNEYRYVDVPIAEPFQSEGRPTIMMADPFVGGLAEFHTVSVWGNNLSLGTNALYALHEVLIGAIAVFIAFMVYAIASSLRRERSLGTDASKLIRRVALLSFVGGIAASLASQFGAFNASREIFDGNAGHDVFEVWHPPNPWAGVARMYLNPPDYIEIDVPLWPFYLGIGLAVMSMVIQYNHRLTTENAKLLDEVSGLV